MGKENRMFCEIRNPDVLRFEDWSLKVESRRCGGAMDLRMPGGALIVRVRGNSRTNRRGEMTLTRRLRSIGVGLVGLVATGAGTGGCVGHEHAPAEVPSASPVTRAGDRFDVVVPAGTPVVISAIE